LTVDRLHFSWKSNIPSFLTFLFQPDDFYEVRDPEAPEYPEEIGFKTRVQRAIEVLDRHGYNLDFFAGIYETFLADVTEQFEDSAKDQISSDNNHSLDERAIEERYLAYLSSFPALSPREQLADFLKLLALLLTIDFQEPPNNHSVALTLADGRSYQIDPGYFPLAKKYEDVKLLYLENLHMYLHDKVVYFPPWITKVGMLFDDDYAYEYPEIITLMLVRLALDSVSSESAVTLNLSDIMSFEEGKEDQARQVRELHAQLAHSLVRKVNLYNHTFQNLLRNEQRIREEFIKTECRDLLIRCEAASTAAERGRLLERLTELVFTSNRYFDLVDKRVSTGDEEIDLVVKNGVNTPFWNALQSPLFFIECKNWKDSVGAKELRDFEGKLRNHARLVKVGFFVSMNGFTKEVANELKRGSRESQHVVLLERKDLDEYVASSQEFFAWLERKAATFY
jgi:hypothetical protein